MNAVAPDPRRWKALILVCAAIFVVVLDIAIVNVALPSIGRDLDFAPKNLQWVITAYTLTYGGFLLLGGRAADLLGPPHDLHGRPRALHRRVARLRPLHFVGDADRRPRGAGPRRRGRDAGRALDRLDDVHRGRGAEQGTRRLGRGRRQRRGCGRALRRHPHEVPRLGVDLLGQRPRRRRRARADADLRAREPARGRRARVRPARGDSRHRRARQPRLRHLAGARQGLGLVRDDRRARALRGAARRVRALGGARARAADAAPHLPDPAALGGQLRRRCCRRAASSARSCC